jgi:hypothetical protein
MLDLNKWFPGYTVENGGVVYDTPHEETQREVRVVLGYVHERVFDRPVLCLQHWWYRCFPPSWE